MNRSRIYVVFVLTILLFFSMLQASSYILPEIGPDYYIESNPEGSLLRKEYRGTNSDYPFFSGNGVLFSGEILILKTLIPPGVRAISFGGTSNSFNVPNGEKKPLFHMYHSFDDITLPFCSDTVNTDCFDYSLMIPYTGAFGHTIERENVAYEDDQPFYAHFILELFFQFNFGSINYTEVVSDPTLYNAWRNERPWAGGPSENSIDGVREYNNGENHPDNDHAADEDSTPFTEDKNSEYDEFFESKDTDENDSDSEASIYDSENSGQPDSEASDSFEEDEDDKNSSSKKSFWGCSITAL